MSKRKDMTPDAGVTHEPDGLTDKALDAVPAGHRS